MLIWKINKLHTNLIKFLYQPVGYSHVVCFLDSRETIHGSSGANGKKEKYSNDYYIQYGISFLEISTNYTYKM